MNLRSDPCHPCDRWSKTLLAGVEVDGFDGGVFGGVVPAAEHEDVAAPYGFDELGPVFADLAVGDIDDTEGPRIDGPDALGGRGLTTAQLAVARDVRVVAGVLEFGNQQHVGMFLRQPPHHLGSHDPARRLTAAAFLFLACEYP